MLKYIIILAFALVWAGCNEQEFVEENSPLPQDRLLGNYSVTDRATNGQSDALQYDIRIYKSAESIYISNFLNSGKTVEASLLLNSITGNQLLIPHQILTGTHRGLDKPTVTAIGSWENSTINLDYTISTTAGNMTGSIVARKQ